MLGGLTFAVDTALMPVDIDLLEQVVGLALEHPAQHGGLSQQRAQHDDRQHHHGTVEHHADQEDRRAGISQLGREVDDADKVDRHARQQRPRCGDRPGRNPAAWVGKRPAPPNGDPTLGGAARKISGIASDQACAIAADSCGEGS